MAYTENSPNFNTPEGKIAKDVALQFIRKKVGKPVKPQSILKEAETMLRLAEEIEQKHDRTLKNMCNRLNVNSDNANIIFGQIANEIFRDGINWGRISVLYTFAGKLAEHAKENNNEQLIEKIGFWVATYVATKSSWIKETGKGWVSKSL